MKKFNPKAGDLVVFNHMPDATLFRVKYVDGFTLRVVDRALEDNDLAAWQTIDAALARAPSIGQLKQIQ